MKTIILANELAKRMFLTWLKEAKGLSKASVDQMLRSISQYEKEFPGEDFGLFNSDRAIRLKEFLRCKTHKGKKISSNSVRTYLMHLKSFFEWLSTQPGYRSKISKDSLAYLSVTKKEARLAAQSIIREYPSLEHIKKLIAKIEPISPVAMRDRAMISFTFLTGMRDSAIVSLPLGCIDEKKLVVRQDPRMGVDTKFSKIIYSKIFKLDDDLVQNVLNWIKYLKEKGFTSNDPLFPKAKMEMVENGISFKEAEEIIPRFWTTASSLRKIFKIRAHQARLPYYAPHTFRHSAISYALKLAHNCEELKAISQNFGHEDVITTLSVYANFQPEQLLDVLERMENNRHTQNDESSSQELLRKLAGMLEVLLKQKNE
jgi:integrase/recombinase XerD